MYGQRVTNGLNHSRVLITDFPLRVEVDGLAGVDGRVLGGSEFTAVLLNPVLTGERGSMYMRPAP